MTPRIIALSGGIGGAKLVLGLSRALAGEDLLVVANTGDDFEHCGFRICPDIDTLLYTLAGLSDAERGWGLAGETWSYMERLRGERPDDAWFQLGDKDLETHRFRTAALSAGASLSEVTAALCRRFGVGAAIVPMSDDPVATCIEVALQGKPTWLPFQEYFVRHRCQPELLRLEFRGAAKARPPDSLSTIDTVRLEAVVVGPSNPYLSIDPILSVPGLAGRLRSFGVPVIAVSPIVGGRAIKGPTAKIMQELGVPVDTVSIAKHYRDVADALIIDEADRDSRAAIASLGLATSVVPTVMRTLEDRIRLANDCLDLASKMRAGRSPGPA